MNRNMYLSLLGTVLVVIVVASVIILNTNDDDQIDTTQEPFEQEAVEVISMDGTLNANNLYIPWTINKSGNSFFLTQREGSVIKINGDDGSAETQDVEVTKAILHEGEGGFLGFTLDPEFETTNKAYAYHTYKEEGKTLNRIVSLTLEDNVWREEDVLLEGIPGGEINNGGRMQIGPDNMIYATTGDTGRADQAQDLENLAGKILRMELNGEVPTDNPFEDSYVYSYGHRNPQGLAWDENGTLYSSEHGEDGHDEINLIEAGKNYGWPVIQGDQEQPDMVSPIYHSGEDTWAPSGMAYDDGKLFIASLAGKEIFTYDIESNELVSFFDEAGRLRDVLIDDKALFTITNNHDNRGTPEEEDDRLIQVSVGPNASAN